MINYVPSNAPDWSALKRKFISTVAEKALPGPRQGRIARGWVGIAGEIQLPGLLGQTREFKEHGPRAGLHAECCAGEDHLAVPFMTVPQRTERDVGLPVSFPDAGMHILDIRRQRRAGSQFELQFERHEVMREIWRADQFVPTSPGQAAGESENGDGEGTGNARPRQPGCCGW